MNIGNNIASLRKQSGLTQEQLAEKCEVSRQAVTKWEAGISEPGIEKLINLAEIFQVSLDELIKGHEIELYDKENNKGRKIDFETIAFLIADHRSFYYSHSFDYLMLEADSLHNIQILLDVMRSKFVGDDSMVYEKYLLKNTTKEERKKHAKLIDRCEPINKYIHGECEIDEALDMAEAEIHNEFSQIYDVERKKKENSKEGKIYRDLAGIESKIKILSVLNDKMKESIEPELKELLNQFHLEVGEYGNGTFLGRFFGFLEQEVNSIYVNDDIEKIDEFREMIKCLKNFIWSQIFVEEEQMRRKKYDDYMEERRLNYKF